MSTWYMEYGKTGARGHREHTHRRAARDMTQPHLTAHTAQDQAHHSARARYLWRTVVLNGTAASSGAVQDHCVARPIWCLATVASQVECSVASGPLDACGAAATIKGAGAIELASDRGTKSRKRFYQHGSRTLDCTSAPNSMAISCRSKSESCLVSAQGSKRSSARRGYRDR